MSQDDVARPRDAVTGEDAQELASVRGRGTSVQPDRSAIARHGA
jgi:hypothetical protein